MPALKMTKDAYIEMLEDALTGIVDGLTPHDLEGWTGSPSEDCEKIYGLSNDILSRGVGKAFESNKEAFNIIDSVLFKDCLKKSVNEVHSAAKKAKVSPAGFTIDESLCDFGDLKTGGVVDIMDEAAAKVGIFQSRNYKYFMNAICEALSEEFSKNKN